jgi:hypothetical protein
VKDYEQALRLTAWNWAAETLGVEATTERLAGLVEVTARVSTENLRPALEVVIQTEPRGFLPSPGAVIAAANRIADRKRGAAPRLPPSEPEGSHARWMDEMNPERWTSEQWRAHKDLMDSGGLYAQRCHALNARRHEWAIEQLNSDLGHRPVAHGMRIQMRREFNREARLVFPSPDPLEVG